MRNELAKHHRFILALLIIGGVAGTVAVFLPFTSGVSPLRELVNIGGIFNFWELALPLILPIIVSAAAIRWTVSGSFFRLETACAYVASILSAGLTIFVLI